MVQVAIDERLAKQAKHFYPDQSLSAITDKALESYLSCVELLQMKGILKDGDLWDDAYEEDDSKNDDNG